MGWELVLCVSVFRRSDWSNPDLTEKPLVAESMLTYPIFNAQSRQEIAQGMATLAARAAEFLRSCGASLVVHVVVTTYALEVGYHVSSSPN